VYAVDVSSAMLDEVRRRLFSVHCQHQQVGVVHPKLSALCRITTEQLALGNALVSLSA